MKTKINSFIKQTNNSAAAERIRHPHIASVIDESKLMLDAGGSASLIVVCGPPGAGKTTLGDFLVEAELKNQAQQMAENAGFIPAVRVEALSSGEDEFDWKLFYQDILEELDGELDAPRTAYGVDAASGKVVRPAGPQSNTFRGVRKSLEQSLRHRGTRFIVVDEAAHIFSGCRTTELKKQVNTLKSLSNKCRVQWILLGSYDLFELVSLSGQLARRIHTIHFGRYREDLPEDVRAFRGCLKKLAESMPSLRDVDLVRYVDVLHQNTLGCVGNLHDVLVRLNLLVAQNGWSELIFCKALFTEAQVTKILSEIIEGEESIAPGLQRNLLLPKTATSRKVA